MKLCIVSYSSNNPKGREFYRFVRGYQQYYRVGKSINNVLLELSMDESRKMGILFINIRSDYGGGPSYTFDLVTSLSSYEKYVV